MRKVTENELPKIRAVLRDDKPLNKNNENTFNYYIRFNGRTLKKPSGLYINPKKWNKKKKEVISDEKSDLRSSLKLKEKIADFEKYILNYEARGGKITPKVIDDYFEDKRYDDFFSFYTENLKQKNRELSSATLVKYNHTLEILKSYCKKRKAEKLPFIDITLNFLTEFDKYLILDKNLGSDTANNYHKNIKTTLNDAIVAGIIDRTPYLGFKPFKNDTKIDRIPLTENEIDAFENVVIPENKAYLNKAKDYFIFMLYTGLRFSDFMNFKITDISYNSIKLTQQKTKNKLNVHLHEKAQRLINRHFKAGREVVFSKIDNQVFNRHLKEIAKLAGIDKQLHSHIARHTFATWLKRKGASDDEIRDILGHQNIKTTAIYAKTDRAKLNGLVNSL